MIFFFFFIKKMGGQLSVNYTDIKPLRTIGCWKVHSAVRKTTNEKVSLWMIDSDILSSKFPDKHSRLAFMDKELASVQTMRKIIHPHVIKILEIAEKKPDIGFASEPIENMHTLEIRNLHQLDSTYISYQIAETLGFINDEAHFLYLGLTPSNILIDNELNVHLMGFEYASQLTGQSIIPSQQLFVNDNYTDYTLRPPEFLSKQELANTSDVYLFGLFVYNLLAGKKLYENNDPHQLESIIPSYVKSIKGVPTEFVSIIEKCLTVDPLQRPSFSRVLESPAFNSMQMKSLRYIDMILTKQAADKFKFYKGLASKIDCFSPQLLRTKILPKLLEECKNDVRFAPILLASIFQISQDYDAVDFQENVWGKISFLSGVTDPPEVAVALLRNMWLLLKKLDIRLHKDYVYPIFFNALTSTSPKVQSECLQKVDVIIDEMNENSISMSLIPRLMELVASASDPSVSASAMRCVSKCLSKCDNESFIMDFFNKIIEAWNKRNSEVIASGIIEVIEPLKAPADIIVVRVIPIASIIAGSHVCKEDLKNRFCDYILKTVRTLRDTREQTESMRNPISNVSANDPDNPFATPSASAPKGYDDKADDIFGPSPSSSTSKPLSSSTTTAAASKPKLGKAVSIDLDPFANSSKPMLGSSSGLASFDRPISNKPSLSSLSPSNSTKPTPTLDLGFGSSLSTPKSNANSTFDIGFGSSKPSTSVFSDFSSKPSTPSTSLFEDFTQPKKPNADVFRSGSSLSSLSTPGNTSAFRDNSFGLGGGLSTTPSNTFNNNSTFGSNLSGGTDQDGFNFTPAQPAVQQGYGFNTGFGTTPQRNQGYSNFPPPPSSNNNNFPF